MGADQRRLVEVMKANGEVVPFEEDRLLRSMERSGASEAMAATILEEIGPALYERMPTREIYRLAFARLQERSRNLAARYKLKRAIMELGPSGFPFERFVARLLEHQGYTVRNSEVVQGRCVSHEIDVVAKNDHTAHMIECKYHNRPGLICDVKVPLYIWARFKDVEGAAGPEGPRFQKAWVVTNTRFSGDAMRFAECSGMQAVGWDQPARHGLKDMIDASGLYPLTCLITLPGTEKVRLMEKGYVLCTELRDDPSWLGSTRLPRSKRSVVMDEIRALCDVVAPRV